MFECHMAHMPLFTVPTSGNAELPGFALARLRVQVAKLGKCSIIRVECQWVICSAASTDWNKGLVLC
jgi:hypothetical protein